jgi:MYXO-CTERM domain-containing protein
MLLKHPALGADVDNDGLSDVFSWEILTNNSELRVARHEFDADGGLTEVWVWSSTSEPDLLNQQPLNDWPFAAADFDGDGTADLAFVLQFSFSTTTVIVLDGDTGELLWSVPMGPRDGVYHPLIGLDVAADGVYGDSDGVLDVVRSARGVVQGLEYPTQNVTEVSVGVSESNGMFVDLGTDGIPELVTARLNSASDPIIEAWSLLPTIARIWGPVAAPSLPPDVEQAIASLDVNGDGVADVLYASAASGIDALSGVDGTPIDGFPIYMASGDESEEPPLQHQPITAVIVADLDGDGLMEAIVGSRTGYVYAINVEAGEDRGMAWSFYVGAEVISLATGDVDGDGEIELLVSCNDGVARVVDGLGVALNILEPLPDDCIAGEIVTVSGTSTAIETVDITVLGALAAEGVPVSDDGTWSVEIEVPLVAGLIEILAAGLVAGNEIVFDLLLIQSKADLDSDGVTACGGDCDDEEAAVAPGLAEICDGLDNDCDPSTDEDADEDGDTFSICDGDCDDADDQVAAGLPEICDDSLDNDCDGLVDAEDDDCSSVGDDDDDDDVPVVGDCSDCGDCSVGAGPGSNLLGVLLLVGLGALRRRRSFSIS